MNVLLALLLLPLSNIAAWSQTVTTANLGANQVTLQITSTTTGLGSLTVLKGTGTTCGSTAQTVVGHDSNDAAAYRIGSLKLVSNVTGNYTVRNLAQSAAYTVCLSVAGGTPVSTNFTTTAANLPDPAAWVVEGTAGFSAGMASYTKLAFAPDGTPYVAYQDWGSSFKATVMKFDGSNWVLVGSANFSAGSAAYITLAFAPDGTPYVAYEDGNSLGAATVMKYNGTNWVAVGTAGFSAYTADYESLAIAPDGTPFLAYQDYNIDNKATVMKFDGSNWVTVSSAGFSAGMAKYESLAFAPDGTPYLAYEDGGHGNKATVMKFDGTSWTLVGTAGFSSGIADCESLAIGSDGTPFLVYADQNNGEQATAMKYDGTNWVTVGPAGGYSSGIANMISMASYISLAIAPDGTPYAAFEDFTSGSSGFSVYYKATVIKLSAIPSATTNAATNVTTSSATLNGTVNDNGVATTISFDFGTTTSYGMHASATTVGSTSGATLAAGSGATAASVNISGLSANTPYHFRVGATANGATTYGADTTFTTDKTTPTVSAWPTAGTVRYGQTLASSALTGGTASISGTFAWTDSTIMPTMSGAAAGYSVTFTPGSSYSSTYDTVANTVRLTVNKATPTVTWPTASSITYGQTLASSTLTGGSAVNPYTSATVAGQFAWTTSTTAPAAGTAAQSVTFTPTDTTDYAAVTGTASVVVNAFIQPNVNLSKANLGANQVTLQITSDTAGLASFTVLPGSNATCGSMAQTVAGRDSHGAAAYGIGSLTLASSATGNYTVRNLRQSTAYSVCFSVAGGTPISTSFTTNAENIPDPGIWTAIGTENFPWGYSPLAFAPDGTPYLVQTDGTHDSKLTVLKYDATQGWIAVGPVGFTEAGTGAQSLAFAPDGTPYVAYQDAGNVATVMKYNGSNWVTVGVRGFTAGWFKSDSLKFSPDGMPYLLYANESGRATVMKYNGTSWVTVGTSNIGQNYGNASSLAFAPDGTPYVACSNGSLMKYDDANGWTKAAPVNFRSQDVQYISLAFSLDGTPYIAYQDSDYNSKATVMMFNGTSWVTIGTAGFSAGAAGSESLAFAPDGMPYVAYTNLYNHSTNTGGTGMTLMKYDGTSWSVVGTASFGAGETQYVMLAISPDGTPYVTFQFASSDITGDTVLKLASASPSAGPSATTLAASNVTSTGATLNGTVNDNGKTATISFDYGITSSYGSNVPATTVGSTSGSTLAAGSGATATSVNLSGLGVNTTYHFRVNATANGTTINGADMSLTTSTNTTTPTAPTNITWPTASSITSGQLLASSILTGGSASVPGAFAWTTPSTAPPVGTASYSVTFTPTDTTAYNPVTGSASVTVTATNTTAPTNIIWPTASSITSGQLLASSILTGGSASVPGIFAWTTPAIAPPAGTASYRVTFTPTDLVNYSTVTGTASVTVTSSTKTTPTNITWPTASSIQYGQLLAASTLTNGTASVPGAFAWTLPTLAPAVGTSNYSVTFTPTDTTTYSVVTGTASVAVTSSTKTTPTSITWPTASSITYGQTLVSSILSGSSATIPGVFSWAAPTFAPPVGIASYNVTFTPTDTTTYNAVAGSARVTVTNSNAATPTNITWPTASSITAGQLLASSILTGGSASVPGVFAWTTPGTVPPVGTASYSVTFTPTDTTAYNSVIGSASVTVTSSARTTPTNIAWPTASSITSGQLLASSILTGGTASVPGVFAWTTPSTAPPVGTASYSVTFTPTDLANYSTVTGTASVTVTSSTRTTPTSITWPAASSITDGQLLAASTLSGGTASVPGTFAWTLPTLAPAVGTSDYSVTFTPSDTTTYSAITGTASVTVTSSTKTTPTSITWPTASSITYGQTLVSSSLSGSSATIPGVFSWAAPTFAPPVGIAGYNVTFTPSDTTTYSAIAGSASVTVTSTNTTAPTNITWPTASSIASGQLLASSILTGGSASVPGVFAWTTPAIAPPVGTAGYSVTFTPTDLVNYSTVTGVASVTVTATNTTAPTNITWPTASSIQYGQLLTASTLTNGMASVPGAFAWTLPTLAPAVGTSDYSVTFTPTDTTTYSAVTGTASVTVTSSTKTTPTNITWPTASSITYGQTLVSSTLSSGSASIPGAFTWAAPTFAPPVGIASYNVTFTPTDTTTYNAVAGSASVTVTNSNAATPTNIVWPTASSITAGQLLASSILTGGSASVPGVFAWTTPNIAPPAGTPSYSVTFMPTDIKSYASVTKAVSLIVNPVLPVVTIGTSTSTSLLNDQVLFTVLVSSSTGAPAGSVVFSDGNTALSTVALVNGTASYATTSLAVGNHSIAAVYQASANYQAATSNTVSVSVLDFSVAPATNSGATQSVVPGSSVTYLLSIAPTQGNSLPATATLSLTGVPSNATVRLGTQSWTQLTSTSWKLPANTTLDNLSLIVSVSGQSAALAPSQVPGRPLLPIAMGMLLLPFAYRLRRSAKQFFVLLLLAVSFVAVAGLSGCGSKAGNGFFSQQQKTYTVTATVTSGSLSHSTDLRLTVQ